jgi:hypothetical protein
MSRAYPRALRAYKLPPLFKNIDEYPDDETKTAGNLKRLKMEDGAARALRG